MSYLWLSLKLVSNCAKNGIWVQNFTISQYGLNTTKRVSKACDWSILDWSIPDWSILDWSIPDWSILDWFD